MVLQIRPINFLIVLLVCDVIPHPITPVNDNIVQACLNKIQCGQKKINKLKDAEALSFAMEVNSRFGALRNEIKTLEIRNETWTEKMTNKLSILNTTLQSELTALNKTLRSELTALNKTLLGKIETANNSTIVERRLRLYFQSLLHMGEFVEELFNNCWPKWTKEYRPVKRYDRDYWKILLMNIEDEIILALRKVIARTNLSDEKFIEKIEKILSARNKEAHYKMSDAEKFEALDQIKEHHPLTDVNVAKFLIFGLTNGNLSFVMEENEMNSLEPVVRAKTSDERKSYKLIMMEKAISPLESENSLEIALKRFETKFSSEANKKKVKINPIAYALTWKASFVLFSNFDGAYFFWSNRNELELCEQVREHMVIVDANSLYFTTNHSYIKIEEEEKKICEEVDDIINNSDLKPIAVETFSNDIPKENTVITVYYKFHSMESLLTIYQKLKKAITLTKMTVLYTLDSKNLKEFHCSNPTP